MRVLVVSHHAPKGVYGDYDYNLCRHLEKLGVEVTDIALIGDNSEFCKNSELIPSSRFVPRRFGEFFSSHVMKRILTCHYDLIHVGAAFWSFLPLQISLLNRLREKRKPVVMVTHAFHPEYQKSITECIKRFFFSLDRNYLLYGFRCVAYDLVDHIICMSNTEKRYIAQEFRVSNQRLSIVPNGVDVSRFKEPYYDFRDQYKVDSDYILLFVGQLIEMKGIPFLLDAVRLLVKEKYDVSLLMVSYTTNPNAIKRLKRQAKKANVDDRIRLLIRSSERDLVTAYKNCDLLVLPSVFNECSPTVILEAMACGKPVVASRIDGIPALVKNEETGFLVSPANSMELAEKISRLLESEKLRHRMGSKAQIRVMNDYSWNVIAKKILHVYKTAINDVNNRRKGTYYN